MTGIYPCKNITAASTLYMYMYIHVLYIKHVSNGASLAVRVCLIRLLLYTLHRDDPVHMVYRTPHIHLNGDGEVIIIYIYIYMIHVFLAAAFFIISSVVKCYTVLCRLSNSDGLLIMKAPYKQKRCIVRGTVCNWCIITIPLILLNTQEDVQPYYEAYSYLAKALRNDQQFQVGL